MKKMMVAIAMVAFLAGCSAKEVNSAGARVRVVTQEPQNATFLGTITAHQGNAFTGPWTSNTNMEQGALNELRNEAAALGGDTVVLITQRAGVTGGGWGNQTQTNVVMTGSVYKSK